jgi:type IV fimbrial biogenesis protein FimT
MTEPERKCRMKTGARSFKQGQPRSNSGFSLFELIVTIAVVAILAAFAIPAMREFQIRTTVTATTNELIVALNMARAEAVKRGRNVSIVAESGNWNNGWSVQEVGSAEILLRREALPLNYQITSASTGGGASTAVLFNSTGALVAATAFDFNVCRPSDSPDATKSRRVIISGAGAIRSRRDTTGSPAAACS